MKGNNTVEINQATMVEAIQGYFEKEFAKDKAPQVLAVRLKDASLSTFIVELSEKESAMPG